MYSTKSWVNSDNLLKPEAFRNKRDLWPSELPQHVQVTEDTF